MARIAGVNIPDNKHAVISLTYIFGVGRTTAQKILEAVGIAPTTKVSQLDDTQLDAIRAQVANYYPRAVRAPARAAELRLPFLRSPHLARPQLPARRTLFPAAAAPPMFHLGF